MKGALLVLAGATAIAVSEASQAPPVRSGTDPSFEVASIRRNVSNASSASFGDRLSRSVSITNATVRMLIQNAYGVPSTLSRYKLLGGSDDVLSARFDIIAKIPDGEEPAQRMLMLRNLLRVRFGLRVHTETRPMPVYSLILSRGGTLGPRLRSTVLNCAAWFEEMRTLQKPVDPPVGADKEPLCQPKSAPFGVFHLRDAGPISRLVGSIQGYLDRPLVDATQLSGNYEWDLAFSRVPTDSRADAPSLFTALREQLGLVAEPQTQPVEVLVIDSVTLPSEN